MTQPAQQPQSAPPAAPAVPQGQPAQQPPAMPLAQPAQYAPQHMQPQAQPTQQTWPTWPGATPQVPPQQQQPVPGWQQPLAPAPPQQPGQQQLQPQPYQVPALPAAYPPPPPPVEDDQGGYDLARLPKAAREEIERLRTQAQQHTTQLRTASVSQQAWALAPQLGVNPQALIGSLAWQQAAAQLDPNAPDYAQRLPWTIQAVLAQNPWLAAAPARSGQQPQQQPGQGQPGQPPAPGIPMPARSGGEFTGAPTGGGTANVGYGVDRLRNAYSQQT